MPIVYGYQRVSTVHQKDSKLGLASQEQAIDAYFKQRLEGAGYTWGGHFVDSAVSGAKTFLERKAGKELGNRANRGDVVLMHKIDRGFRKMSDMLKTIEIFDARGVGLRFLVENLATDDGAMGQLMIQVLGAFAEFERKIIGNRIREAMAVRIAQGQPVNQQSPLGFEWYGPKGKRKIRRDNHDRAVMEQIVKWRRCGATWDEIVDHVAKHKVMTSSGGRWGRTRVRRAYVAELYLQAIEAAGRSVEGDKAELLAYREFCATHLHNNQSRYEDRVQIPDRDDLPTTCNWLGKNGA